MDDLISRQTAIREIENMPNNYNGFSDTYDKAQIIGTLEELPSVDAVEVVRCKDCKWFGKLGCAIEIVDDSDKPKEDDYCSFAERKENG